MCVIYRHTQYVTHIYTHRHTHTQHPSVFVPQSSTVSRLPFSETCPRGSCSMRWISEKALLPHFHGSEHLESIGWVCGYLTSAVASRLRRGGGGGRERKGLQRDIYTSWEFAAQRLLVFWRASVPAERH